jgi:hypothetical protein
MCAGLELHVKYLVHLLYNPYHLVVDLNHLNFFPKLTNFVDDKCVHNRIPSSSCMLHFVHSLLNSSILNGSKLVLVVTIMYGTY